MLAVLEPFAGIMLFFQSFIGNGRVFECEGESLITIFLKADLASEKCSYAKIRAELRSVLTVVTRQ